MSLVRTYVNFLAAHPRVYLLCMFFVFVGCIYYAIGVFAGTAGLSSGGLTNPNSESYKASRLFAKTFVAPQADLVFLVSHPTLTVDTPTYQAAYASLKAQFTSTLPIYAVTSYLDYPLTVKNTVSADRTKMQVTARIRGDATFVTLAKLHSVVNAANTPLNIEFGGTDIVSQVITSQLSEDLATIEQGGIPVLIVVLILVFGGFVAIVPSICIVLWTLAMTLAIMRGIALSYNVTVFATNATTIIGTGLAIDFSLFFHIRFKEEMNKPGADVKEAVIKVLSTSGRSVTFSAITLCSCLSGLLQFQEFYLTTMGASIMLASATSAGGSVIVIPLLQLALGDWLFYLSTEPYVEYIINFLRNLFFKPEAPEAVIKDDNDREDGLRSTGGPNSATALHGFVFGSEEDPVTKGIWYRTAKFVMQHPWAFIIVLAGLHAGMMWVFIAKLRLGNGGLYLLPLDSEVRRTYDDISAYIPSGGGTTLEVYMSTSGSVTAPDFLTALDAYTSQIEQLPHVTSVRNLVRMTSNFSVPQYIAAYSSPVSNLSQNVQQPFFISNLRQVSRTTVYVGLAPNDDPMPTLIRSVRSLSSTGTINTFLTDRGVTGQGAEDYDTIQDVSNTFGYLILVMFFAMYTLLFLMTGSLFLPFKAIITATLSLVSSFGFIVLIFQEGPQNAQDLLEFRPAGTLDPLQLLFIFAVSFGLSLDYEVFMLSRIQEIYMRTKDTTYAVCAGIDRSARVVTYAALLLCIVLGAFLNSKVLLLKYIGAGIGITVVLDATIIRSMLVPAMMAVMGDWNWWAPEPMQKFQRALGFAEVEMDDEEVEKKEGAVENARTVSPEDP